MHRITAGKIGETNAPQRDSTTQHARTRANAAAIEVEISELYRAESMGQVKVIKRLTLEVCAINAPDSRIAIDEYRIEGHFLAERIGHPRRGRKPEFKEGRYPPLDEPACSPSIFL
jgi:hypothetical protein